MIYHKFPKSLVIHLEGVTHTISSDDPRYPLIIEMINAGQEDVVKYVADSKSAKDFLKVKGRFNGKN